MSNTIVSNMLRTVCVSSEGYVYSFGYCFQGSHGHEGEIYLPTRIPSLKNIKSVVGSDHTVCLDYDGNVYTFGSNRYGELGIDVDNETLCFTHIPQKVNVPPCKEIYCGVFFTICLSNDGSVYSFGHNLNGEIGNGTHGDPVPSPQKVPTLKNVEFIECGGNYIFCKTSNNEVYCWGFNQYGQLGLGHTDKQYSPVICSDLLTEDVIEIKCGYTHTLVLTSNQCVLSCGDNTQGRLGREIEGYYSTSFKKIEDLSEISRIECGNYHSLCIDINNDLYVFGNNKDGQLGLGDTDDRNKPTKNPSLSNLIDFASKGNRTFVKTLNNEIYAFGENRFSTLGVESNGQNQLTPIRVFEDNEDIWFSNINKSKAKSARSILPIPSEGEEDNSPPKKKQKTKVNET